MATKSKDELKAKEIPEYLVDPTSRKRYRRGRFLGKGGFAKCYELTEVGTEKIYAGKIVSKQLLVKQHQKDKMAQEISIHREIDNIHIVGFNGFFEDEDNVYIVLELCRRRSLMEMHKRRKAFTEPETRYFLKQLLMAVKFLHDNKIIHRDLKLGNLFLNDELELKLGDFGLATRIDYDGERKRTLCGTPNYIAPEVLGKKGHSFEVDMWSVGCILYTLLVGKPPFETQTLKETYMRIKKNEYHIPSRVGGLARSFINRLLQPDPSKRPTVTEALADEFLSLGYCPPRLPVSCLTIAPRFDSRVVNVAPRKPLLEINAMAESDGNVIMKKVAVNAPEPAVGPGPPQPYRGSPIKPSSNPGVTKEATDYYLGDLAQQLSSLLAAKPSEKEIIMEDEAEDPAAVPVVWVSKWVDYSDKYGFGYQLCDDSIGVIFNDLTKLLLLSNGKDLQYIERDNSENFHALDHYPSSLDKKVRLLNYFQRYMTEHLLKAGGSIQPRDGDEISRMPFLRTWFRTSRAVVMHLTNGTMQVNFFRDHTKIILCPLMGAVTYIDGAKNVRTYRFSLIKENGCSQDLASRLQYAYERMDLLRNSKVFGVRSKPAA